MSLWRDEPPSAVTLAVAAFAGLVALLSLTRVFESSDYLIWAVPGVAIGAALAVTLGRRSLALAFGILIAATLLTLPALFARELTASLLPTPDALRLISALLRSGLSGMVNEVAPVPVTSRYLVVLWIGSLAGGYLGGAWIVVGRPLGAIMTALGTVAYAGQVGVGQGRSVLAFAAVAVFVLFLLTDGRHRIATWSLPRRTVPLRLGIGTLAAALIVGLAAPAVIGTTTPWFGLDQTLRPRVVVIKPLSDVRRQLDTDPEVEVMRVRSTKEAYWRLTALDTYTGNEWLLEARPRAVEGGEVPAPDPATRGELVHQHITITSLLAPWLPAAYAARQVDTVVPLEVDEQSSTLLLKEETLPGLSYDVISQVPSEELPPPETEHLSDPDGEHETLMAYAAPIVEEARTPYGQALALERHFRTTFGYDETVAGGHDIGRLERFLEEQTGYCEQFAAVMTLMLRGLGTPARVAVGFLPGGYVDGEYIVTTKNAHAWVEAHIPGHGWMAFDPTPGRGTPSGEREEVLEVEEVEVEATPPPLEEPEVTPAPEELAADTPEGRGLPLREILYAMLTAMVVGSVPSAKALRRRQRRSGLPRAAVLGAYSELLDRLADLGVRGHRSETEWELWHRAYSSGAGPGADQGAGVVGAAVRALYGPDTVEAHDADQAWRDLRVSIKEQTAARHWLRRLVALYDPRTLVPSTPPPLARLRAPRDRQPAGV